MRIVSCLKLTLAAISILMAISTMVSQVQPPLPAPSIVPLRVVDLNSAERQELTTLEGVTVWIAEKIISGRPYKSVDELKERKIVDEAVYEKIKTKVGIDQTKAIPKRRPIKAPFGTGPGEK